MNVVDAMLPYMRGEGFGNPESVHAYGQTAKEAVEEAAEHIHALLGSQGKGRVIFTSGGTESNNLAFTLCVNSGLCDHIVTSATEHKSVLEPAINAYTGNPDVKYFRKLSPKKFKGRVTVEDIFGETVYPHTMISIMHVNNETGVINDVASIGREIRKSTDSVFFHVDCVQSAGATPISVLDMNADLVSVSSHKIHGPKGVGCLWLSDRLVEALRHTDFHPMILGGGQQEGFRSGTLDVPGIVGFGEAAEDVVDNIYNYVNGYSISSYRFCGSLSAECERLGVPVRFWFDEAIDEKPFAPVRRSKKILPITFPGIDAETLVMMTSDDGVCISNGAACNAGSSEPSYVLVASGMTPDMARNTVRISFSPYTTVAECDEAAKIIARCAREILSYQALLA